MISSQIHLKNRGQFYFLWSEHWWRRTYKYWYFKLANRYESHVYQAGLQFYRPNSMIIDVGAFVGLHAISWASQIDGNVIAFEPIEASFQMLCKNKQLHCLNDERMRCYNYALGGANKQCVMQDDTLRSSVVDDHKGDDCQTVSMRTLDSFDFQNVSVIKLDVEGHESEVIKGAIQLIRRCKPVIIFENKPDYNYRLLGQKNNNANIAQTLQELGYRIKKLKLYDYIAY